MTSKLEAGIWIWLPLAVGFTVPSLVILCLAILVGDHGVVETLEDIWRRQFAAGHNLFLLAVFGLIPFVPLSTLCWVLARKMPAKRLAVIGAAGLLGILAVMIPAHVSVWYPLYGPGRMSSTAVLAFLFIPFYCLAGLLLGLLLGYVMSLLPLFREAPREPPEFDEVPAAGVLYWLVRPRAGQIEAVGFMRSDDLGALVLGRPTGTHCSGHAEGWRSKWLQVTGEGFVPEFEARVGETIPSSWQPPALTRQDRKLALQYGLGGSG